MHKNERLQNLIGENLNLFRRKSFAFFEQFFDVLLKVKLQVLEHQVKLSLVKDNFFQFHDILMLQFL